MITPSLLEHHGKRVPREWEERVQGIDPKMHLIWNPHLNRFAVVRESGWDSFMEIDGYGYPGWFYFMTVEEEDGSFRPLDDRLLRDLRAKHAAALGGTREQRLARYRQMQVDAKKARDAKSDALLAEATAESMPFLEAGWKDRKTFGPGTSGNHKPYGEWGMG